MKTLSVHHVVFLASLEHMLTNWIYPTALFIRFYAEDRLLRKKVLESSDPSGPSPTWGQEATVKMQCVLEDRTVVEKDSKLVFVIGEGDVNQVNTNCYAQYSTFTTQLEHPNSVEQVNCPLCVSFQFNWCQH